MKNYDRPSRKARGGKRMIGKSAGKDEAPKKSGRDDRRGGKPMGKGAAGKVRSPELMLFDEP